MSLRSAALFALWHPALDARGRDEVSQAMGLLMRNTGLDESDARRLLLAVASRLPEQDRAKMEEEINV